MRKLLLVSCLLVISFINSLGQWYYGKYQVTDINFLSKQQLEESLTKTKDNLRVASIFAGIGGSFIIIGLITLNKGLDEDVSFLAQILGSEVTGKISIVGGVGMLTGGTIAGIGSLSRIGRIKSVIQRNYPSFGSLNISPTIISNSFNRSYCPGFTLSFTF